MVHDPLNYPDGSGGFWFYEAVPNFNRMLFHRHSPDDIQLRGNRTAGTPPTELHPIAYHAVLVAGARRLAACKQLGWTEIPATVVELYDIDLELAEIDENLIRMELTALDRAEQLERRKWIFGQKG